MPFVNAALAARAPYQRSIAGLRAEGVRVISGPDDDWTPHPPGTGTGTGTGRRTVFPWRKAFQLATQMRLRRLSS
ncbi:hypothetical protein ACN27J_00860 [Solwaraspora sp. WMMB762]|uniref:hypothetical protein n=1 Tax=Solwaraspora sp. WMMB762 TaxID=3404120 RepID=UPI003B958EF3